MVESSEGIISTVPMTSLNNTGNDGNEYKYKVTNIEQSFEEKIIMSVAHSSAIFKSQQIDEPELTIDEKINITSNILHKSSSQFLSRFGKYLSIELLEYFTTTATDDNDYEIIYYINKLKRYFNSKARHLDKKNKRYEALKILIDKGEYFSEIEMMKRNPLLYDNLIGKYLTEGQRKARDNLDTTNITFVNLLLEGIERDHIKKLKKNQEDAENEVLEENDSDSESEVELCRDSENLERNTSSWGEISNKIHLNEVKKEEKFVNIPITNITTKEKNMLRQEFITQMYQSFLDGKDLDFDYSLVDDNEAYDNVDLRTQDEEEQYFDSETPELVNDSEIKGEQDESEDELDKYMTSLKEASHMNEDDIRKSPI